MHCGFSAGGRTLCDRCTASENVSCIIYIYLTARHVCMYTYAAVFVTRHYAVTPCWISGLVNRVNKPSNLLSSCSTLLLIDLRFAMSAESVRSVFDFELQWMPFHTRIRVHDELPIWDSPTDCNDCHDKDLCRVKVLKCELCI